MTRESLALSIVRKLQANGHRALLVGGCVRDRLLGITPKDFDVGTSAVPSNLLELFPGAQLIGAHFGVILVSDPSGVTVEVATFRSEGAYSDGRHPDAVHFETQPEADARRRDFTINGLMQDPVSGELFDFVGGRADLAARVIRAIGDPYRRFAEDRLRMLRAVRFAARLGFSIEAETLAAIQSQASAIGSISAERIRDELVRILTEGDTRRGFELLDQTNLLAAVLPEVKAMQGVEQPPEYHPEGDVWTHVLLMLGALDHPSLSLALGVLLHDVGKPPTFSVRDRIRFDGHAEAGARMTRSILSRLKLPNSELEHVTALVANHMKFKDVLQMRPSTLKRFLRLPQFEEHLELHRLDCLASNGYTQVYDFLRGKLSELEAEDLSPERLITGHDLLQLGYSPGPEFRCAFEAVEIAQLEGEIRTKADALNVARLVLDRASSQT